MTPEELTQLVKATSIDTKEVAAIKLRVREAEIVFEDKYRKQTPTQQDLNRTFSNL